MVNTPEVNSDQMLADVYKSVSCEFDPSDWKETSSIRNVILWDKPILLIPIPGVMLDDALSEEDNDRIFTSQREVLDLQNACKLVTDRVSLETALWMHVFNSMTGRLPILLIPRTIGETVDVYVVEKPRKFNIITLTKETVDGIFGTKPIDRYNPPGNIVLENGSTIDPIEILSPKWADERYPPLNQEFPKDTRFIDDKIPVNNILDYDPREKVKIFLDEPKILKK